MISETTTIRKQSKLFLFLALFVPILAVKRIGIFSIGRKLDETSVIHDSDFHMRHQRDPTEINSFPGLVPTIPPSTDPCARTDDDIFGISSTNQLDIQYTYEIEIKSEILPKLETEVIPSIEEAINESLVQNFFGLCSDQQIQVRRLAYQNMGKLPMHRSLEIIGISSNPPDRVDDSLTCQSKKTVPTSLCNTIWGGLVFYFDEDTDRAVLQASVQEVLAYIQQNMDNDNYISAFEGIIKISYGRAFLPETDEEIFEEINVQPPLENVFSKSLTYAIIGAVSGALIILAFLFGKDDNPARQEKEKDGEGFLTGDFVEIASNLTDEHDYGNDKKDRETGSRVPEEITDLSNRSGRSSPSFDSGVPDDEEETYPIFGMYKQEANEPFEKLSNVEGDSPIRII